MKSGTSKGKYPDGIQILTCDAKKICRIDKEIWNMVVWSANVFKGTWSCSFHGSGNFVNKRFLCRGHSMSLNDRP